MTKRERYLNTLRNKEVDSLVWAPNFDYWFSVNKAENTIPEKYADMSRNDIVRAIGGYIWNRAVGLKIVIDSSVKEFWRNEEAGSLVHEYQTPAGSIREVYSVSEGEHRARSITEHFVKDLESLKVMKFVVEAMHYEADYQPTYTALEETGDDGIVLNSYFCVPFLQFAKSDAGYQNGFYMWMDHRNEVDSLIELYAEKFLQGYKILADGPADVIATGDNMDSMMISPDIFREYVIPFYQKAQEIFSAKNKMFEGHWCGRTQNLLPFVPGCCLDIVEAIVTKPMADIALSDALDTLKEEVVLQGGIPSVLVCNEGGSRDDFDRYVRDVICPLRGRKGFVLGMSDNVPPNADFARIEAVAEMIKV